MRPAWGACALVVSLGCQVNLPGIPDLTAPPADPGPELPAGDDVRPFDPGPVPVDPGGTDPGPADPGADTAADPDPEVLDTAHDEVSPADPGTDPGTDAGADAGPDAGTDAGADAGTDAGNDADPGLDPGDDLDGRSGCTSPLECPGTDDPCLEPWCDVPSGLCGLRAMAGTPACNDGNACTEGDLCRQGACEGSSLRVCDDGNPCTDDSCDPASGCRAVANQVSCGEAQCADSQTWQPAPSCQDSYCVASDPVPCGDLLSCTDDLCSVDQGCIHLNNCPTVNPNCSLLGCRCGKFACNENLADRCSTSVTGEAECRCGGGPACDGSLSCCRERACIFPCPRE